MLAAYNASINLAVKDIAVARRFYEDILGLTPQQAPTGPGLAAYTTGTSRLLVYVSENAGTNKATACTWSVGDELPSIVATLRAKGVSFEHYPLPGATMEGDLHVFGSGDMPHKIAWFKDPDNNILSLINR